MFEVEWGGKRINDLAKVGERCGSGGLIRGEIFPIHDLSTPLFLHHADNGLVMLLMIRLQSQFSALSIRDFMTIGRSFLNIPAVMY